MLTNNGICCKIKNKKGEIKICSLHRLMAETFIPNPNNYPIINHINGDKQDNRVENLEWCTFSYNNKEAYRLGLRKVSEKTIKQFKRDCLKPENIQQAIKNLKDNREKAIQKSREKNRKKVVIYKNEDYKIFESEIEACKYLKVAKGSVGRVANNNKFTIKGYKAKYLKGDEINDIN